MQCWTCWAVMNIINDIARGGSPCVEPHQVWPLRSKCCGRGAPTKVVCAECNGCLGGENSVVKGLISQTDIGLVSQMEFRKPHQLRPGTPHLACSTGFPSNMQDIVACTGECMAWECGSLCYTWSHPGPLQV